jgi:hypothetical protein
MELMRSCISVGERVPASGGRANFGQIGRPNVPNGSGSVYVACAAGMETHNSVAGLLLPFAPRSSCSFQTLPNPKALIAVDHLTRHIICAVFTVDEPLRVNHL